MLYNTNPFLNQKFSLEELAEAYTLTSYTDVEGQQLVIEAIDKLFTIEDIFFNIQ